MPEPAAALPLAGRVALITGASRGIGAATAAALAGAGAGVVLAARPSFELDALALSLSGLAVPTDVRDPQQVQALAAQARAWRGRLDVVVTAAGLGRFAAVQDTSIQDWDEVLGVNLRGTFLTCQSVLPWLLEQGSGHVFTLVSIAGTHVFSGAAAYCASKWGVLGFTRVLMEEVRRSGIKVTAVLPGSVDSPFWDAAGGTTLPRAGMLRPEDVARAIVDVACQPPRLFTDEIVLMPPAGIL